MRDVGKWTLMVLGAAVAALPFTGGVSLAVAAPIAAVTGLEVAIILAVFAVGLTLLRAVDEGYDKIEVELGSPIRLRLILKKKHKKGK